MSPEEQESMIESAEKQMLEWQEEKLAEMENWDVEGIGT